MRDGDALVIESAADAAECSAWTLQSRGADLCLAARDVDDNVGHLRAALEAAFTMHPTSASLTLDSTGRAPAWLIQSGAARLDPAAGVVVERAAFWQQPGVWTPALTAVHAQQHVVTDGRRHPRRPPKPQGIVYRRFVPWLGRTLGLRSLDAERDLPVFHRWMNDPVVDRFWGERGELARHRAYLDAIAADPHATALVLCLDDEPFGYVEAYWAKEDRIAPFCDAQDHDRGWHVLVGEAACRGKPFLTAWMPSVAHYLFLDDCRTQRIVIEPRADNDRMIKSLARNGYALVKEFDFPHKRAMLGVLLRERFFGEALWNPRAEPTAMPA